MRVIINENELGLLFRHGKYVKTLKAGPGILWGSGWEIEKVNVEAEFVPEKGFLDAFPEDPVLAPLLQIYDIGDQEMGLLFHSGNFLKSLNPGRHVYLGKHFSMKKAPVHAPFDTLGLDVGVFQQDEELAAMLAGFDLEDDERGLLFKDSLFVKMLTPGRHVFLGKGFGMTSLRLGEEFLPGRTDFELFTKDAALSELLRVFYVPEDQRGLLYKDDIYIKTLKPGRYAFLGGNHRVVPIPMDAEFCPERSENEPLYDAFLADPDLARILHVYHVNKEQRGLLFARGEFQKMLGSGTHAYIGKKYTVEIADVHEAFPLDDRDPAVFLEDAPLAGELDVVEVPDGAVALHYQNGRFREGLPAGRYAFWNSMDAHTFQTVSITEPMVSKDVPAYIFETMPSELFQRFELQDYEKGQLYYDGKYIKLLDGGTYYFWNNGVSVRVNAVDTRVQQLSIQGQELLTLDKVSVRINCVCRYKISDYELIDRAIQDYKEQIHVLAQLALREYIGAVALDDLLANKEQISDRLLKRLREKEAECYVSFMDAGVKDIILPGAIKDIMQDVIRAEKQAQASVITRREEVASTRSLLNTAKLLDENQTLMRLKEMEYQERQRAQMLECAGKIAASLGNKATINIGGGNLFEQLRELFTGNKSEAVS